MVRRKLTLAERWQAVGMSQAGLSNRRVAGTMGVHHSVIDRLMQHLQATGMVYECLRSGKPCKTTPREDRLHQLIVELNFWGLVTVKTVNRRLKGQHLSAKRPIKQPQLILCHLQARCDWSYDHLCWNIHNWKRVHWPDESQFLLHPVYACILVAYKDCISWREHDGYNSVWWRQCNYLGCFSFNCRLDLHVFQGNLNGAHMITCLMYRLYPILIIIHYLLGRSLWWLWQTARSSHCKRILAARGDWHNTVACHVPWYEPNWARMGLYW